MLIDCSQLHSLDNKNEKINLTLNKIDEVMRLVKLGFSLFLFFIVSKGFAQVPFWHGLPIYSTSSDINSSKGQNAYLSTDSLTYIGIKLIDGGSDLKNSQFCQVKQEDKIIKYTPYEVKEYGFKDGRVYLSREIHITDSSKMVFLERLQKGKMNLYYYKGKSIKTYFIEKDSTMFVEIPKKDKTEKHYSDLLFNYTADCPYVSDACKLASYNKKSMSRLISQYNKCELEPFPFLKYGLFFGMVQSKLVLSSNTLVLLSNTSFRNDKNLYFGLFVDAPINVSDLSGLSVFTSFGLYQSSFSSIASTDSYHTDILINQTTIKTPLMIRYTFPLLTFRPYFNIGVNYSYNLRNESVIYMAEVNDHIIQWQTPEKIDLISDHQFGYAYGMGIQCHLNYKRILSLEIRYNKEYSKESEDMFNKNTLEIISGINF